MQGGTVPNQREGISADAIGRRFENRQGDRAGEGRIHRGAAGEEHAQTRLRGQGLAGRHHAVGG